MSGFQGLDPDAVDRLGVQLTGQATTLEGITHQIDALVRHATTIWHGHDVSTFMQWWQQQHRPAAVRAASTLSALGRTAQQNAAQQRVASSPVGAGSGGGGGWSWGGGALGIVERGWRDAAPFLIPAWAVASGTASFLDRGEMFSRNSMVTGRYTNEWRRVIAVGGDLARFKRSPILQTLHASSAVQAVGRVGHVLGPVVGAVGIAGSTVDIGQHAVGAYRQYQEGDGLGVATELGHAGASALKLSHNPVAYLGGAALEAVTQDVELIREIDWKQGFPNPLSGDNFTKLYLPALGDSVKDTFLHRIPKIFG